mgnify:FL=1
MEDIFGFTKSINNKVLDDPKKLKQIAKIFNVETDTDRRERIKLEDEHIKLTDSIK